MTPVELPPMKRTYSSDTDLVEFRLNRVGDDFDPPLFTVHAHPPKEFQMTQDEWDHATALCLKARIDGRWRGDDILHPIPWEDDYGNGKN